MPEEFRSHGRVVVEPEECLGCSGAQEHYRCKDCMILMGPGHVETEIAVLCRSCRRAREANRALKERVG